LRDADALPLKAAQRGVADIVKAARRDRTEGVFIYTAPNMRARRKRSATRRWSSSPCRPGVFDLDAVKETIEFAREAHKPYAVIVNAAPPKRQDVLAALNIPVWGGQITQRSNFSLALAEGEGAMEFDAGSYATAEIGRLWAAIEKSVKAIRGAHPSAAMHRVAA
jgi:chromosome partitioning protein